MTDPQAKPEADPTPDPLTAGKAEPAQPDGRDPLTGEAKATATVTEVPRKLQLTPSRFTQAEFTRNIFSVIPPRGHQLEDMLAESYWAHVGSMLKVNDRIEVFAEDGSFFAELIVLNAGRLYAQVHPLRHCPLDAQEPRGEPSEYDVSWGGPHHKWRVKQNGRVLHHGCESKQIAQTWADSHAGAVRM